MELEELVTELYNGLMNIDNYIDSIELSIVNSNTDAQGKLVILRLDIIELLTRIEIVSNQAKEREDEVDAIQQ